MTLRSERGRIELPKLDDRTWQDLVDEMVKQYIPKYAPQWTDHNPSDLGITLIELFAWLAEGLIYRLNQVPKKNYIAMLNLLDIKRDPMTPARVELTFEFDSKEKVVVTKGTQVQTRGTETEAPVVFETDDELAFDPKSGKTSLSISAHNALTVWNEELTNNASGEPFQVYQLAHRPLFQRPGAATPYDHLVIQVFSGKTTYPETPGSIPNPEDDKQRQYIWRQVSEIAFMKDKESDEGKVYQLDPVSGEIRFGGAKHGKAPEKGSKIRALTYRYVAGGSEGNVPAGKLTVLRGDRSVGVVSVENKEAAKGGSDEEAIQETMRRAPQQIRNRDRAVTAEDYEYLAREASTEVALVKCLPPLPPKADAIKDPDLDRSPGMVNIIIVPKAPIDVRQPPLDEGLKKKVKAYLDARRTLAARVEVQQAKYVPVIVQVTVKTREDKLDDNLKSEIQQRIFKQLEKFLHPVLGGPEGRGWSIGDSLSKADLYKAISVDKRERYIEKITILSPVPNGPSDPASVKIEDHQVICLGNENWNAKHDNKYLIEITEEK